jgi:hypothetical protein
MRKVYDWIVIDFNYPSALVCKRCDTRQIIPLPLPIDMYIAFANSFKQIHKHCQEKKE